MRAKMDLRFDDIINFIVNSSGVEINKSFKQLTCRISNR